ncbi:outer membrane receptor protein involved in Fe transport [Tenacibaculum skagerrakense]|uniref:Outer membrane receptor protein involved in Fe transport n=1 Tax=Tenacibaculum skagerrakense TaxID=186571 RepID=A0A4R2P234_9FLAO|nr:carboxypeptidase-like regulatory domain-containing protein [Tenacibaculum skagerrakense]TCP28158.1 outer membrane receptor protein involved in Fe transport [Tenacibaculum skagerrakense]
MIKLLFSVCFLFSLPLIAQKITLSGEVRDSLLTPLTSANIIAKPKDLNQNLSFTVTDDKGRYLLKLDKNKVYTISISFMGYEQINHEIKLTKNTKKDFFLSEAKNQLDEVVIDMPMILKKDTIVYNTKYFVTGEERKLKNILRKLPGVEVEKNGDIIVRGKKVTKLLVEGKKFFGGGTKLAVENIPADAVKKVVVLDNYNEVAFLKKFSDSDEMAMNIELKEDKKRFVFGDLQTGKGNKDYYKTHANLFYYSPKTNINFIGNLNNIAEQTFTIKDYLNFSGGINAVFNGNFNYHNRDFSQFIEPQDILSSKQYFNAINITKTTSNKMDISGYAIFSHSISENFTQNLNEYSFFTENRESRNEINNLLGIGKLNMDYNPSFEEQWYIRTQIKKNKNSRTNFISSEVNNNINNINTNNKSKAWYTNQNIEWHKKQSQNHTFSSTINYTYDNDSPTSFWSTSQPILQGLIPVDLLQDNFTLQQLKENEKHHLHTVFKDFWTINNENHIYSTIGNTYQNEKFISKDSQILDDGSENDFGLFEFNNSTDFKLNDFFIGLHYKWRRGIFTFKQGVYIHRYNWQVKQETSLSNKKWVFLPDFSLKIEFNKSKKLQLNYNLKSNFSDVSKLADKFLLKSYNSLFRGNETLENELFHNLGVRYSRLSLFRGLLFTASANYSKKIMGFRNAVKFDGVNQLLTLQMAENPSEDWRLNSTIRKRINKVRYKLSGNYFNSKYLQNIDNIDVINENQNYSFNIGAETLFDDFPNIEAGFKSSLGNFTSNNSPSRFTVSEPYLDIKYDFLKSFLFLFDYRHYSYQNKSQSLKNTYNISNASISYKKEDSPWSFKIDVQNLFNTQFKQSNAFSEYLISDTKTYILPRIFMFSIGYNL